MTIDDKSPARNFTIAIILVCGVFVAILIGSGKNLDFSPAYLLVIAYLLWMRGRGKHYFFLGAITTALMAIGFFLTTSPDTRTPSLLFSHLTMVILIWVVIYFIYWQKKLIEMTIKNSEQFTAMFENATEGILLVDKKGKILVLNKFAEQLFGYTRDELIGQQVEKLIPDRFSQRHAGHRHDYHKNPHNRPMGTGMELYALRREGWEFPVEVSLGYYTADGNQTVIVFVNDITERNRVRQQLITEKELTQKLNEELEARVLERTHQMEEALRKLEDANISLRETEKNLTKSLVVERELGELKSRFVTMASHEFRTPLTTILSSVFLLENGKEENKQRSDETHFGKIRKSVKNLTDILNDFLSLSKLEEGKVSPTYSLTDIKAFTEEIIEEVCTLKKPGQSILFSHSGKNDPQAVDKQILKTILVNLLSNAVKFSPTGGNIELYSLVENDQLKISVSDQGIGIPEEEHQHLFTRFFRAANAQNIEGTGLGLNIVKKYIDLMQGTIEFKSGLDQGTKFIVTIPIISVGPQNSE